MFQVCVMPQYRQRQPRQGIETQVKATNLDLTDGGTTGISFGHKQVA